MDFDVSTSSPQYKFVFGNAVFDSSLFELTIDGKLVKAEHRPLEILLALLLHVDEVMTKDELLETVWPEIHTVENVLANAITKLRKALGSELSKRIITHPRIGYRFASPIERQAIGRKLKSTLKLKTNNPVIGRPNFKLEKQISAAPSREVWQAKHSKTKETRIFKFASDGEGLASLKREVTLFRLLTQSKDEGLPIVRILDWNFESEPFYIECEDAGVDLNSWAKTKRQLKSLSSPERIELCENIAEAVSNVHGLGILHRDLKPTNILISHNAGDQKKLSVRLIDFGSGQVRNSQELADFGISPMGFTREIDEETQFSTPLYLAPEIVQGQSHSIQSDIYSLGIIIYQILSGNIDKPMATGWQTEIHDPLLQEDIANATHGEVRLRTESAASLKNSLEHIEDRRLELEIKQALQVRTEAAEAALKRSQARRPWIYATSLALALGFCGSVFFAVNAKSAQDKAEANNKQTQAANEFLRDVLISGDPRTPGVGPDASVISSLTRAQKLVDDRFSDDIETQLSIKHTIATVYAGLQDTAEIDVRNNMANIANNYYGSKSDEARIAQYLIAHALIRHGKYKEADTIIEELDTWPTSNNPMIFKHSVHAKGRIKLVQLKFEDAAKYIVQYEKILLSEIPINFSLLYLARIDLAQCYSRMENQSAEAVRLLRTLLEPPFTDGHIPEWRIVDARTNLGTALVFNQEYDEAESILKQSLTETQKMYGEDSPRVVTVFESLSHLYAGTKRPKEAALILGKIREFFCRKYGQDNIRCAVYIGNEGINYIDLREYQLAENKIQTALTEIRKVIAKNSPYDQVLSFHLATALMETGGTEEAGHLLQNLDVKNLKAGSPDADWNILLGALKTRYELRTNYSDDANKRLKTFADEMIELQSGEAIIERTLSDVRQ